MIETAQIAGSFATLAALAKAAPALLSLAVISWLLVATFADTLRHRILRGDE